MSKPHRFWFALVLLVNTDSSRGFVSNPGCRSASVFGKGDLSRHSGGFAVF